MSHPELLAGTASSKVKTTSVRKTLGSVRAHVYENLTHTQTINTARDATLCRENTKTGSGTRPPN